MSTFNGQEFLSAQLDSILAQQGVGELCIYIRDDGSTDNTIKIITDYQAKYNNIFLDRGVNIGAYASFFQLLKDIKLLDMGDIYLFADQDDFWLPKKIQRSYAALKGIDGPALYSSSLSVVDRNLGALGIYRHRRSLEFFDPIYVNSVTGCSSAWNYQFLELVRIPEDSSDILMHDWWLYLTAMYLGSFHYDEQPLILYRQHGGNVVGIQSFWQKLKMLPKNSNVGSMSCIKQFLLFLIEYRTELIKIESLRAFYAAVDGNKWVPLKASVLTLGNLSIKAFVNSITLR